MITNTLEVIAGLIVIALILTILGSLGFLALIALTGRGGWFQRTFFPNYFNTEPRTLTPRQQAKFDRADAAYRRQSDRYEQVKAEEKARLARKRAASTA